VYGSEKICRLLLEQYSDQHVAVDCEGHSAMHYATRERHAGVSTILEHYSLYRAAPPLATIQALDNAHDDNGSAYAPVRERGSSDGVTSYFMGHPQHNPSVERRPQSSTPSPYFPLIEGNEARPTFLDLPNQRASPIGPSSVTMDLDSETWKSMADSVWGRELPALRNAESYQSPSP
jgi:hypothetical protein